jgi:hypothetical protein
LIFDDARREKPHSISRGVYLSDKHKSNNERLKEIQEKLKKRSEEIFENGPDFEGPQHTGNPSKIFEDEEAYDDAESDK